MQGQNTLERKTNQYIWVGVLLFVSLVAFWIRWLGIEHITADIETCLIPWSASMKTGYGVSILSTYDGDYNMPYVTVLWLLNYLPGRTIIKVKLFSIFFEYAGAVAGGLIVSHLVAKEKKNIYFVLAYSALILYPSAILNGGYWGQCDFIYVTFLLYMIYALLKDRPVLAMVLLGCAFSFKLQAVLILPVLVIYYWKNRRFSLLHFLIVPLVMELLCIPAILGGCSVFVPFSVYLRQLGRYPYLYVFYPNFWAFFREAPYYIFSRVSQFGVIAVLGVFAVVVIRRKEKTDEKKWLLFLFWSVFVMMCFLPCMHERYGMLLEVVAILYAFLDKRCSLYAIVIGAGSYIAYLQVTFAKQIIDDRWIAFAYLLCLGMLTWHLVRTWKEPDCVGITEDMEKNGEITRQKEIDSQSKQNVPEENTSYRTGKVENQIIDFVNRYMFLIAYVLLTLIALWVRKPMIECMSADYLPNLIEVEGNAHTTLYMTLVSGITFCIENLPFLQEKTLFFLVKVLCIGADVLVAALAALVCNTITNRKEKCLMVYLLMLFLPSALFNGVIWGHLDSLAISLILAAVLLWKKHEGIWSSILLGLSWALLGHYLVYIVLPMVWVAVRGTEQKTLTKAARLTVLTGILISFVGLLSGYSALQCLQKLFMWGEPKTWMLYPVIVLLIFACMKHSKWIPVMTFFQLAIILDWGSFLYELPILPPMVSRICYIVTASATILFMAVAFSRRKGGE